MVLNEETREAKITVELEQFSLAVGKGGQNVRLAAKLTGWKIDINSTEVAKVSPSGEGESLAPLLAK